MACNRFASIVLAVSLLGLALSASPAAAQNNEQRFHDLFVTAGYCTAFGAAVGTAFLAWTDDPADNLGYVAMGASLGFLGGSVLGTYVIFSPTFVDGDDPANGSLLASGALPSQGLVLRPTWDRQESRLASIEGGMTLLSF